MRKVCRKEDCLKSFKRFSKVKMRRFNSRGSEDLEVENRTLFWLFKPMTIRRRCHLETGWAWARSSMVATRLHEAVLITLTPSTRSLIPWTKGLCWTQAKLRRWEFQILKGVQGLEFGRLGLVKFRAAWLYPHLTKRRRFSHNPMRRVRQGPQQHRPTTYTLSWTICTWGARSQCRCRRLQFDYMF